MMGGVEPSPPAAVPAAGTCPFTIDRPVMRQRWERLTFLHWPYDPAAVQRLLPRGLEVETFDGAAWVGLVPFSMHVATGGGRVAPWASQFCETNVRAYVRGRVGHSGIWFFSLDAARLGAVAVARVAYGLPYYWSGMRMARRGTEMAYGCRRRLPGPAATSRVRVSIGAAIPPDQVTDRDHFLTARWLLFSVTGAEATARWRLARAAHPPWPLHQARATLVQDSLMTAAGLPAPDGDPLALYSPGVDVRIGKPELVD
jgi:uncharacterized protein YqjF (DUF2071 family)